MIDETMTLSWERSYLKGAYVAIDIGINVEEAHSPLSPSIIHTFTHIYCIFPHTFVVLSLYFISVFHSSCSPITLNSFLPNGSLSILQTVPFVSWPCHNYNPSITQPSTINQEVCAQHVTSLRISTSPFIEGTGSLEWELYVVLLEDVLVRWLCVCVCEEGSN